MLVYMEVHQHASSILGYVTLRKIFQRIPEAWEYAPVNLKLQKVCSLFVPNNITISQLYLLTVFQIIIIFFFHCVIGQRRMPGVDLYMYVYLVPDLIN